MNSKKERNWKPRYKRDGYVYKADHDRAKLEGWPMWGGPLPVAGPADQSSQARRFAQPDRLKR